MPEDRAGSEKRPWPIIWAGTLAVGALTFLLWSLEQSEDLFDSPLFTPGKPRWVANTIAGRLAHQIQPDEIVLGVLVDGAPRAYPLGFLDLGEHVNDRINGHPVLVTW